jgi:putative ABC transport system permease protein
MNVFKLCFSYLRSRALLTAFNLLLLALGIGMVVLLLLAGSQLQDKLERDARGIDLVVGAKGSPLQLILSSIYHVDVPTGNIPLAEAEKLTANPLIRRAIPLALGDSFKGYRIVGTDFDYLAHYGATTAQGRLWERPMEAVLGAEVARKTGLHAGAVFASAHGLTEGGELHEHSPYHVVGVLVPTGSVVDRLVLTSVASVWKVHEHHDEDHEAEHAGEDKAEDEHHDPTSREITALLIQYRSPLAAATLPRLINTQSALQAASPAVETARLLQITGVGLDGVRVFAAILIVSAALSIFIALYNALHERQYDLAIMRTLGATPRWLLGAVLFEGLLIALGGALLGLLAGHIAAELLGRSIDMFRWVNLTGWTWEASEFWLLLLAAFVGLLATSIPAWQAYRTDIAKTLAEG